MQFRMQLRLNLIFSRAQRIQNLAYALIAAGIRPGDRVAVLAPNTFVNCFHFLQKPDRTTTLLRHNPVL